MLAAFAGVAFVVFAGFEVEQRVSCARFDFDSSEWRRAKRAGDTQTLLPMAEKIARCGTLDGRTYSDVVEALGLADFATITYEGESKPGWVLERSPMSDAVTVRVLTVKTDSGRKRVFHAEVEESRFRGPAVRRATSPR